MKPIYLGVILSSVSLVSCAQNIPQSKVPSVVLNAALVKYPGVNDFEWEKKKTFYEAEFKVDSVEHSLYIDAAGKLLQHSWEINKTTLPQSIQAAVKTKYPGYKIDDASQVDSNGQIIYELELEASGKKDLKLFFSVNAELITNK